MGRQQTCDNKRRTVLATLSAERDVSPVRLDDASVRYASAMEFSNKTIFLSVDCHLRDGNLEAK